MKAPRLSLQADLMHAAAVLVWLIWLAMWQNGRKALGLMKFQTKLLRAAAPIKICTRDVAVLAPTNLQALGTHSLDFVVAQTQNKT